MQIFGYDFSDIQRAQQGGRLSRAIDTRADPTPQITQADLELLDKCGGIHELEAQGYFGTADRLKRSGMVDELASDSDVGMFSANRPKP